LFYFAPAIFGQTGSAADTRNDFDSAARSAAAARDAGHVAEAIANYRRAVELRPSWQEGWFYLGTLQYDADQYAGAIFAFQKLVELAPDGGPAWNFLGLCEFETRDFVNALAHLEKGQQLGLGDDPEIAQVSRYHLALLLNRSGDFDRASKMIVSAFAGAPYPAQAKVALGLALLHAPVLPEELNPSQDALVQSAGEVAALLAQSDSVHALALFPQLVAAHPDTPYLHGAWAKALAAAGRDREALAQQREERRVREKLSSDKKTRDAQLVALYSNSSVSANDSTGGNAGAGTSANADAGPDALWTQAMADYSAGKYSETIAALRLWTERRPPSLRTNDGTAWAVTGLSEFALNDYDNAFIHLQRGQDLGLGGSPEAVRDARYHLGILLNRNAQYDAASRVFAPEANSTSLAAEIQFALGLALLRMPLLPQQVSPSQISLVRNAGEIALLLQESKYDRAFPLLQQLIKNFPATPFLHYTFALGLASLSQYDQAIPELRGEIRISPSSELPHLLLASIALKKHTPAEALPEAQRAVQLAPQSAKAHYLLGRAHLELNQDDRALRELETANLLNSGSPEIHFNLAKAYARANLPQKADEERATFARLNALAEQQRSLNGSQSYGAAENSLELSASPANSPPTAPNPN
jgi:tetratricopeptide (TPR) repeat protein